MFDLKIFQPKGYEALFFCGFEVILLIFMQDKALFFAA